MEIQCRLDDYASVFQAEVWAISLAAQHVVQNRAIFTGKNLTLYSDSRSGLEALDNPLRKSKLINHAKETLNDAGRILGTLHLRWVRAHVGLSLIHI